MMPTSLTHLWLCPGLGAGQGGPTGPWRVLPKWGFLGCSNGVRAGDCRGPYFGAWHAVELQRKFVERLKECSRQMEVGIMGR